MAIKYAAMAAWVMIFAESAAAINHPLSCHACYVLAAQEAQHACDICCLLSFHVHAYGALRPLPAAHVRYLVLQQPKPRPHDAPCTAHTRIHTHTHRHT